VTRAADSIAKVASKEIADAFANLGMVIQAVGVGGCDVCCRFFCRGLPN
jgi:hypothetical protein